MLFSDDKDADDKIREDCVPGVPHITFYNQPGVMVNFINPQSLSGLFEVKLSIVEGDTPSKLANRLTKFHKQIKCIWFVNLYLKLFIESSKLIIFIFFRSQKNFPVALPRSPDGSQENSTLR